MTEENPSPPPRKLELSSTQVAGSALAAVSAAFFASWLGTAGTLIGAAVGSVVATVGSATYTWWLRRTSEAVKRTAAQVRETGMGSTVVVPVLRNRHAGKGGDGLHDEVHVDPDEDDEDASRWSFLRHRPWGRVALLTAAVLLAVLGSITVVEAVIGKPISALLRGEKATGTSLGHHTSAPKDTTPVTPKRTSTPTPSPSVTPSGSATPTPTPSSTPTPTPSTSVAPSDSATPTPTPSPSSTAP